MSGKKPSSLNPLIVGVDPGTTTGMALLDLDGNLVLNTSKKNFSKSRIIREILEHGNPIIFSSDKAPLPAKIEKLAAAFFAKSFFPRESLRRKEKLEMVNDWTNGKALKPFPNKHEKDALAAAIFAWNRVRHLVRRINKRLESIELITPELEHHVKTGVLIKGDNIEDSIKNFFEENG